MSWCSGFVALEEGACCGALLEDRCRERQHEPPLRLRSVLQEVAHEVGATPLPLRAHSLLDRFAQAGVVIEGGQLDTAEATVQQFSEEHQPEWPDLRRANPDAKHFAPPPS